MIMATSESPLCTYEEVAEMIDCTTRHLQNMVSRNQMPQPIRIGGGRLVRFRKKEILDWIQAGCPAVKTESDNTDGN